MRDALYSDPRDSATHQIIVYVTHKHLTGVFTRTYYCFPSGYRKHLRDDVLRHIISGGILVDQAEGKAFRFRDMDWTELSVEVVEKARHN